MFYISLVTAATGLCTFWPSILVIGKENVFHMKFKINKSKEWSVCVCVCALAHGCTRAQRPEEGIRCLALPLFSLISPPHLHCAKSLFSDFWVSHFLPVLTDAKPLLPTCMAPESSVPPDPFAVMHPAPPSSLTAPIKVFSLILVLSVRPASIWSFFNLI